MGGLGTVAGAMAFGRSATATDDEAVTDSEGSQSSGGGADNAIAFITDGAGLTQISSARYLNAYQEDPERYPLNVTPDETTLGLDRHDAHGTITTFPDDPKEIVTDSAAAATSFATGVKTYNGAIGGYREDGEFVPVETVLETARDEGYATGLVTTTELTHATPAAFASHVPERGMQEEIARQFVEESGVDVMLGGQRTDFTAKGREDGEDLIAAARDRGYTYVETADELDTIEEAPVLGLFSEESHLDYYVDRQNRDGNTQPGLASMARKAIELLEHRASSEKGFFLMVESGRVDHAGHANDPAIVPEQHEASMVAGELIDYVDDSGSTYLVSTADHSTGGMSLGRDGPYDFEISVIDALQASATRLTTMLEAADSVSETKSIVAEWSGIDNLTDSELAELRSDSAAIQGIINERARIGWTTNGHTGADVPAFAHGPTAEYFDAVRDNTDIARALATALGFEE